jgi:hypothetical protein
VARDEQHTFLVADLGGDGDIHVREDDDVVQWDKQKRAHDLVNAFLS